MKTVLYIFCLILLPVASLAQHRPQRTAEDIASKQTEMLVRELQISDSVLRDTLYRMHLKYACQRLANNTRAEAMRVMYAITEELEHILPAELFQQFMNHQVNYEPHRPQMPFNRISTQVIDTTLTDSLHEAGHTLPGPGWPQSPIQR